MFTSSSFSVNRQYGMFEYLPTLFELFMYFGCENSFFSAMLLSLLIYKVQLAKLCGITQHIVPVVRRKKLGSTGLMLSGSSKFFDLHPTVWSHEVTIAFKTVTI